MELLVFVQTRADDETYLETDIIFAVQLGATSGCSV